MARPEIKRLVEDSKSGLEEDLAKFSESVEKDLEGIKKRALERI